MQARTAAAFTLGFAAGMAALGIALWSMGHLAGMEEVALATSSAPAPALVPATVAAAPVAYREPVFNHGERKQPPALPGPLPDVPRLSAAALPAVSGSVAEADRFAAVAPIAPRIGPRIAMPLASLDPRKLESTFAQPRNGHAHEALDIMAQRGTPVLAVAEGNVEKLFASKQGGLTVYQFDNAQQWCYYYAHLDHYAPGLKEGVLLRKGDVLGFVGSTGDASPDAPHLHFAVFQLGPDKKWWQGSAVDPLPLLQPDSRP